MIILILINLLFIMYIYMKYYRFYINDVTTKIEDEDSIILGYIQDNGINNSADLILAEIIELNIKKYIVIEYNKENMDKYNYTIKQNIGINSENLNRHELLIMNFLFSNKMEITKKELEEKLNNTFQVYNIQFNEIKELMNTKLIKQGIIDIKKQNNIAKISKKYLKTSIILIVIVCIISILRIIPSSLLYVLIYILEKLVLGILIFKASIYTNEGQSLKYKIDNYKINLKNKEFLTNNNTMENIVLNKEFANSIALHINTRAKEAFINNSIMQNATKISKKTVIVVFMFFVAIALLGIIMAIITSVLPKGAIFWIYLIIALIIAGVADVTLAKKK